MESNVLSARRSPSSAEEEAPAAEEGRGGDESKTRKHDAPFHSRILKRLASRGGGGGGGSGGAAAPCAVAFLLLLVALAILATAISYSRPVVCISPQDSIPRVAFLAGSALEGLASDFGSLGVPWCRSKQGKTVEWTAKDLLSGLEEFVPIYEKRPIRNNMYGMGFDHSFGLWFIARWLKPDLMIESGAFKGHSTWVLRQAMPEKHIISVSPRHPEKYLKKGPAYVDGNCTYLAGKDFVDFGNANWQAIMKQHGVVDMSRVLVFFDDHQNELKRVKQALKAGFRNFVFEDNYDTGTGDHYSLRQICDQYYIRGGGHSCFGDSDEARIRTKRSRFWDKAVDASQLCGEGEAWWGVRGRMLDDFNHSSEAISHDEHFRNSRFLESVLDLYWELPPVAGPSLTHQTRYDPARTPDPIVEDGRFGLFRRLGLAGLEASVFNGYTQMVFIQVSEAAAAA